MHLPWLAHSKSISAPSLPFITHLPIQQLLLHPSMLDSGIVPSMSHPSTTPLCDSRRVDFDMRLVLRALDQLSGSSHWSVRSTELMCQASAIKVH